MKNKTLTGQVVQNNISYCCKPCLIGIDYMFVYKNKLEN